MDQTHPRKSAQAVRRSRLRRRGDRGEGIISTAIAVLIMAFLGAAMWVAFSAMWDSTSEKTQNQVEVIGGNGG